MQAQTQAQAQEQEQAQAQAQVLAQEQELELELNVTLVREELSSDEVDAMRQEVEVALLQVSCAQEGMDNLCGEYVQALMAVDPTDTELHQLWQQEEINMNRTWEQWKQQWQQLSSVCLQLEWN